MSFYKLFFMNKQVRLPEVKKKINLFLLSEEGKISKQALLMGGAILGSAVLSGILSSKVVSAADESGVVVHNNDLKFGYNRDLGMVAAKHIHNVSHSQCCSCGMGKVCM